MKHPGSTTLHARAAGRRPAAGLSTKWVLPQGAPENEQYAAQAVVGVLAAENEPQTLSDLAQTICSTDVVTVTTLARAVTWMARLGTLRRHHLAHESMAYSLTQKKRRAQIARAA